LDDKGENDMPKLVKIESNSAVSNFTPPSGNVTAFLAEENDNIKLKVKKSDGTIIELSGGSDTSDATAVAGDILSGKTAYVASGKVTGSITTKAAATYTPGTSDQTISAGQYLTGAQTISGDANLTAGNIKSGVTIFGVTGTHQGGGGAVAPFVPAYCAAYLGSNGCLYVRESYASAMTVSGLARNSAADRAHSGSLWLAYGPFAATGPFYGSVVTQDNTYIQWDGFSELTNVWAIHSLVSGFPGTEDGYHPRYFAWGFDKQTEDWTPEYAIYDLPNYVYCNRTVDGGRSEIMITGIEYGREEPCFGPIPFGIVWNGPENYQLQIDQHNVNNGRRTLFYSGDEEMGMPGEKYSSGNKLYLGVPSVPPESDLAAASGAILAGFALEVSPSPVITTAVGFRSPLLTGTYGNL